MLVAYALHDVTMNNNLLFAVPDILGNWYVCSLPLFSKLVDYTDVKKKKIHTKPSDSKPPAREPLTPAREIHEAVWKLLANTRLPTMCSLARIGKTEQ